MARKATGQVVERKRKRGRVFALRFRAGGERQYVTLPDGTTSQDAERELRHVLADVERGTWRPPAPVPGLELPKQEPTFHEFASEWFEQKRRELRPGTVTAYEWQLTHHLLPYFAKQRLSQITVEEVDRYRAFKVREREAIRAAIAAGRKVPHRPLSDESINKTITRLGQVLEVALEYGHLDRNPATGKRRRLKVSRPRRPYLDRAAQIAALLEAAGRLDREARADRRGGRRALLATLVFAGLRISEALSLRWRHVDLAAGRLYVGEAKTDAGVRQVPLLPALRDELAAHKAQASYTAPDSLVFCTRTGKPQSKDNTRERVLAKAVEEADKALITAGHPPLPERLTQHALRHTYISLRMALGHDLASVAEDSGHSDMSVTYRIYTHVMKLDDEEREELRALVEGTAWTGPDHETESVPIGAAPR
jgi:integrase